MATDPNITLAIANIGQRIADLTANWKPNYTIDGQTISWSDYMKQLIEARDLLIVQSAKDEGPFELTSNMLP